MKIVALIGSPRRQGNTDILVQKILESAAQQGADTQVYYLNELDIKSCKSCFTCKVQEDCDIQDDATVILKDIASADAIVLGTPVYMWQMSGRLKLVIDRMFMFANADHITSKLAPGKKVLWAVTQAHPDANMFQSYFEQTNMMLQMTGFGECRMIIAPGTIQPGDILLQGQTLAKGRELGVWLTQVQRTKSTVGKALSSNNKLLQFILSYSPRSFIKIYTRLWLAIKSHSS